MTGDMGYPGLPNDRQQGLPLISVLNCNACLTGMLGNCAPKISSEYTENIEILFQISRLHDTNNPHWDIRLV